jgi:ribosomal protein L37AE/L43A
MVVFLGRDRCPLCGSFGTKTKERNIFICKKCDVPFNEFGVSPLAKIEDVEEIVFRQQN